MTVARIIGPGRAGRSLGRALEDVGWAAPSYLGRGDDVAGAGVGVDVVVIATPDDLVGEVAAAVEPTDDTVVIHLAGSLGLDVVAHHPRHGALHPLVALPDESLGAARLRGGAWFAVAGDPVVGEIVGALGGRPFTVADADRGAYHAAAVIASNHVVAVLGQAERIAATAGVPFEALLDLVRATVDNVVALGPAAALTGPASRGDDATIARHLAAVAADERATYQALAREASRLAGRTLGPSDEEA